MKRVDKYNKKIKPEMVKVNPDSIPEDLKKIPNWLNWKWEWNGKKWNKPPVNGTSTHANLTFREAYKNTKKDKSLGLGFSIHGNKICAMDFDDVLDKKGRVKKKYQKIFKPFKKVYHEVSPSGTGIRVFGYGKPKTLGGKKETFLEVYSKGRYLTVTGNTNGVAGIPLVNIKKQANKAIKSVLKDSKGGEKFSFSLGKKKKKGSPETNKKYQSIVKMLPGFSADDYDDWLKVGMALHYETNGAFYSFMAWVNWSRSSKSFVSEEDCQEKWESFRGSKNPVTIGTLRFRYREIMDSFSGDFKMYYSDPDEGVEDFNKTFVYCLLKGKAMVIKEDGNNVNFIEKNSFLSFYGNVYADGVGKNGDVGKLAPFWLSNSKRASADKVIFDPSKTKGYDEDNSVYNLWKGFTVEPLIKTKDREFGEGWDLLLNHIKEIVCSNQKEWYNYLLMWLANIVQNPGGKRPGVAVCLYGKKGCGKGTIANIFGEIFGVHYSYCNSKKDLVGDYNGHLLNSIFAFADEAYFPGDKTVSGRLQSLITEPYTTMEEKFIPRFKVENHINLMMASNEDWFIPATEDERRYFCLEVSTKRMRDYEYFNSIYKQIENGGLQKMFHDLLTAVKVDMKVLRDAPRTDTLKTQIRLNEDSVTSFWREVFENKGFTNKMFKERMTKQDLYDEYISFCQRLSLNSHLRKTSQSFGIANNKIMPGFSDRLFKGRRGSNLKVDLKILFKLLNKKFK